MIRLAAIFWMGSKFDREVLLGLNAVAYEQQWSMRVFSPRDSQAAVLISHWHPDAFVCAPYPDHPTWRRLHHHKPTLALASNQQPCPVPYLSVDHEAVGAAVAEYFLGRGFCSFAVLGIEGKDWAQERRCGFERKLAAAGHSCAIWNEQWTSFSIQEQWEQKGLNSHQRLIRWIKSLPKPVGVLACNDLLGWQLITDCHLAGVCVPEEAAIVGVDNDELFCEMAHPTLSSVAVDWRRLGREAAMAIGRMLAGETLPNKTSLSLVREIVTRRSSDITAVSDPELAAAMRFIQNHACETITVNDVLSEVPMDRRRLERLFRKVLGRTVKEEIRWVQVNRATQLLINTELGIEQIATRTGFSDRRLLVEAFYRVLRMSPSEYRHRFQLRA